MKKRYARILAATLSAAMVFTSAPTAAFATELSVSEDAVEAEGDMTGPAADSQVNSLFPTKITKQYKDADDIDVEGAGSTAHTFGDLETALEAVEIDESAVVEDVKITGIADVPTMRPGDKKTIKICVKIKSAFNEYFASYDDDDTDSAVTITRSFVVECTKATVTLGAADAGAGTIKAVYGTGVAESTDANWKVVAGSEIAAVKTTDVATGTVANGVKIETVKQYDPAEYDVEAFEDATYTYNKSTKRFERMTTVTVVAAELKLSQIKWPTGFESNPEVGTDLTTLKYAGSFDKVKYVVTKVTDKDYDETKTDGAGDNATADRAGVQMVQVTYTPGTNYTLVDDLDSSVITISGSSVVNKKCFTTDVKKIVVTDEQIAIKNKKKEATLGKDYTTVIGECLNLSNDYVAYTISPDVVGSAIVPVGTQNIAYTAEIKDKYTYELAGGRDKKKVLATVNVVAPKAEAKITNNNTGGILAPGSAVGQYGHAANDPAGNEAAKAGSGAVDVAAAANLGDYLSGVQATDLEVSYQWYKNGEAISNAKAATYTIADTAGLAEYNCEITVVAKDGKDTTKAVLASVLPTGKIKTNTITVTFSNIAVPVDENTLGNLGGSYHYEYTQVIKAAALAKYNDNGNGGAADSDLSNNSYKFTNAKVWISKNGKDEKIDITNFLTDIGEYGDVEITAPIPAGLDAGTYTVNIQFNAISKDGKTTDVATYADEFTIDPKSITLATDYRVKTEKTSYPYGTKTSDIKIVTAKELPYGTYSWDAELPTYLDYNAVAQNKTIVFTPNEKYKDNFNFTAETTCPVTIDQAVIVVKANDIELTLGDKLPELDKTAYTVEGMAGTDRLQEVGLSPVTLKYIKGLENLVSTVGTIEDAIEVTGNVTATNPNYKVKQINGNVVVKKAAAPTTPPTVAPTPAPVKQSVAAAPKASKAKVSVKAGKKYTLKLKYAAGKKSTVKKVKWTSSKKSVATVSSKGKVTAKKAGKATIYARVYFKDGSMKKIKFTVTVK